MICNDTHTHCHSCWCKRFEWIRIAWIRTGGIRVERIRIGGIRIGGIRFEWICVGYVWCDGYVWDMCGVMDMCGICVVWDMCGICVVWDTLTIFWRTLRRNVFREYIKYILHNKKIYVYCLYIHTCTRIFIIISCICVCVLNVFCWNVRHVEMTSHEYCMALRVQRASSALEVEKVRSYKA